MLIDSLRVSHVLQHDLANLQCRFSKANFQDFDISTLDTAISFGSEGNGTDKSTSLFFKIAVFDR
jgi:hypothetical protein